MKLPAFLSTMLSTTTLAFASSVPKISPTDAARLVAAGKAILVDVREPGEWVNTGVAAPAVLLAKSDFDGTQAVWKPFLAKTSGKQLILYCRSGHRAGIVASALAAQGLDVANAGGLSDWLAAGLPLRTVKP